MSNADDYDRILFNTPRETPNSKVHSVADRFGEHMLFILQISWPWMNCIRGRRATLLNNVTELPEGDCEGDYLLPKGRITSRASKRTLYQCLKWRKHHGGMNSQRELRYQVWAESHTFGLHRKTLDCIYWIQWHKLGEAVDKTSSTRRDKWLCAFLVNSMPVT